MNAFFKTECTPERAVMLPMAVTSPQKGMDKTMKRAEYFDNAQKLLSEGKINEEVFWAMLDNADAFVDEEEYEYGIPSTYAEIEYEDFDDPEAIMGARFDDMNYLRYRER